MNERTFPLTKGARLAMVVIVALLLALAAVLALSAKPAEASVFTGNQSSGASWDHGNGSGMVAPCGTISHEPINNNISAAHELPWFEDRNQCGDNHLATIESNELKPYNSTTSNCGQAGGISRSVWYKIKPTYTSTVSLSSWTNTTTSNAYAFDRVLALWKAPSSGSTWQQVNCSYAPINQGMTPKTATLQAGQTYYLQFATSPNSAGGAFTIKLDWGTWYYSSSGEQMSSV